MLRHWKNRFRMIRISGLIGLAVLASYSAGGNIILPRAPELSAKGYILIDADTGRVLVESNADDSLPPASLTKIMTGYVVAAELETGRISLDDEVPISVNAWRTKGSKMFIQEGTKVALSDLLRGVIVQSGNDASVAIAEYLAGDEDAFADVMNQYAMTIGMSSTNFLNSTGLPDDGHYSSARDMAVLTLELIRRFPVHYAIYAEREFTFAEIRQPNRNRLLLRDRTVDGVKTGYTLAAGYCLVASAERDGMRLVSAVMGASSDEVRMRETQKLLQYGFRYFETRGLYNSDEPITQARIYFGASDHVPLGVAETTYVTFARGHYEDLEVEIELPTQIDAPLKKGAEIGSLRVTLEGKDLLSKSLVSQTSIEEAGIFSRIFDSVYLFFASVIE
ncbi:MAG: D-alanyl-D-alanine carboxypeptidase family protein [Pseudomonadota bacterium]|nr:D-alanyl-D-alanine carboxypeptidase family protein [Pseudomonadota bacterium]